MFLYVLILMSSFTYLDTLVFNSLFGRGVLLVDGRVLYGSGEGFPFDLELKRM